MKRIIIIILFTVTAFTVSGCQTSEANASGETEQKEASYTDSQMKEQEVLYPDSPKSEEILQNEEAGAVLQMKIGDAPVEVEWEDNDSVSALLAAVKDDPLTIQMSMYGGFEQVGEVGMSLPKNDVETVTESGDIVLYSGNKIVVFYGSNSWAYTRLGKITDKTDAEMKDLLGSGDVTITILAN